MSCFSSVFICKTLKAPLKTHYTCSSGSVSHRLWLSMNRFGLEGSGTSRSADKNCVWEGSVFRDRQNWLGRFTAAWLIQWLRLCQQVDITAFYKKKQSGSSLPKVIFPLLGLRSSTSQSLMRFYSSSYAPTPWRQEGNGILNMTLNNGLHDDLKVIYFN